MKEQVTRSVAQRDSIPRERAEYLLELYKAGVAQAVRDVQQQKESQADRFSQELGQVKEARDAALARRHASQKELSKLFDWYSTSTACDANEFLVLLKSFLPCIRILVKKDNSFH